MLAIAEIERPWLVLTTEPQRETLAASHLFARHFKTKLPQVRVEARRGHRRKKVAVARPMFRGYLFVRFAFGIDSPSRVTSAPGVHNFLRIGERYAFISDDEMRAIEMIEDELMKPKEVNGPSAIFDVGEEVRVAEGAFSGLNGRISSLDDDERVSILLEMLGRKVRTQIEADSLEKL